MATVDPPRTLDLFEFSFNFTLSLEQRVAGRMGAPAWSLRKRRLDEALAAFWARVDARAAALDGLAASGLIGESGDPMDHALLDADGRDAITARDERRRHLHDPEPAAARHAAAWNRAWSRWVDALDVSDLAEEVAAYNEYFPIEANLAIDIQSGGLMFMGEPWRPASAPSREAVLARHPLR